MHSLRLVRHSLMLLGVVPVLLLAACGEIASGDLVTEERSVDPFDSLEVRDGVNVELTVDADAERSVSVSYDDNLLDNVITRVTGDTLVIEISGSIATFGGNGRAVTVVVDSIDRIEVSGGADLTASGITDGYALEASGGADADLSELEAGSIDVQVSGGADVVVFATNRVEGDASGGANLRVEGAPGAVAIDTSGGADVDVDG